MMGLQIKHGVDLSMIDPRMWAGVPKIVAAYARQDFDAIITSGRDGTHGPRSLHYFGRALDLRIRHLSDGLAKTIRDEIKNALGIDFDVVLESDHIHVEYDPN